MHAMTGTYQGRCDTRCGLNVKSEQATAWESEVTCEGCGIKLLPGLREPFEADTLSTKSKIQDKGDMEMPRESAVLEFDSDFVEQVMQLRDTEEKKWDEIHEITDQPSGRCQLAYMFGRLPKKERIKNATAADVVRLRDTNMLSWGEISVRCGLPESTCRGLYKEETGVDSKGLRIGKGGRHPGSGNGEATEKGTKKSSAPKKPAVNPFEGVDDADVADMLAGFAIKVSDGTGETEALKVKNVKRAAKGKVVLVTDTGESRTIKLASITAISKKKVL